MDLSVGTKVLIKDKKKQVYKISRIVNSKIYISNGIDTEIALPPNYLQLQSGGSIESYITIPVADYFEDDAKVFFEKCPPVISKYKPAQYSWFEYLKDYERISLLTVTDFKFINDVVLKNEQHISVLLYYFYISSFVSDPRNMQEGTPFGTKAAEFLEEQLKENTLYHPLRLINAGLVAERDTFYNLWDKTDYSKEDIVFFTWFSKIAPVDYSNKISGYSDAIRNAGVKICSYCLEETYLKNFDILYENEFMPNRKSISKFLSKNDLNILVTVPGLFDKLSSRMLSVNPDLFDMIVDYNFEYILLYYYFKLQTDGNYTKETLLAFRTMFENLTYLTNNNNDLLNQLNSVTLDEAYQSGDFKTYQFYARYYQSVPPGQVLVFQKSRDYGRKAELFSINNTVEINNVNILINFYVEMSDLYSLQWLFRHFDTREYGADSDYLDGISIDIIGRSDIAPELIDLFITNNINLTRKATVLLDKACNNYNIKLIKKIIFSYSEYSFSAVLFDSFLKRKEIFTIIMESPNMISAIYKSSMNLLLFNCVIKKRDTYYLDLYLKYVNTTYLLSIVNMESVNYTILDKLLDKNNTNHAASMYIKACILSCEARSLKEFYSSVGIRNYLLSTIPNIINLCIDYLMDRYEFADIENILGYEFEHILTINSRKILESFEKRNPGIVQRLFDKFPNKAEIFIKLGNTEIWQYMESLGMFILPSYLRVGYMSNNINFVLKLKKENIAPVPDLEAENVAYPGFFLNSNIEILYVGYPNYFNEESLQSYSKMQIAAASNIELYKLVADNENVGFGEPTNVGTSIDMSVFKFIYDNQITLGEYIRLRRICVARKEAMYYDGAELFRHMYDNIETYVIYVLQ